MRAARLLSRFLLCVNSDLFFLWHTTWRAPKVILLYLFVMVEPGTNRKKTVFVETEKMRELYRTSSRFYPLASSPLAASPLRYPFSANRHVSRAPIKLKAGLFQPLPETVALSATEKREMRAWGLDVDAVSWPDGTRPPRWVTVRMGGTHSGIEWGK